MLLIAQQTDSKGTAMTPEATLARFREYMVGPTRFMNLLSCFELGIVDRLRENPGSTAAEIGEDVGARPDAVEQLLHLLVKEQFVAHDEGTGGYRLDALADIADTDLQRVLAFMNMVKIVIIRQMFHLTESVQTSTVVGLDKLFGFKGNLFGALAEVGELRDAWLRLAQIETASVYPWYFRTIDIPVGARVLDVLGGNGLGAIMAHQLKASPGLHVTTFDRPQFEEECLRNFKAQGMEDRCSFIGGNVIEDIPKGFDVVMIKHFLDMFDKDEVFKIFEGANRALEVGGKIILLVPVYPEDIKETGDYQADFFPTFILGSALGKGGAQKVSTYESWLEENGFEVTEVIAKDPADVPSDAIITRVTICATKTS
ncbi:methyltransferase [Streptomyces sp. NPDC052043]|uniref:methyltransferase n=1 Tax=Streptomyces sp. NPDC052043 TaxID=3365684 RepID=UPI0037D16A61